MKIYISGPMTGYPEHNYPAFHDAEAALLALGYAVANPARNPEQESWHAYLRLDLTQLLTCDAVATLPGWENSAGAALEVYVAEALSIPVQPMWVTTMPELWQIIPEGRTMGWPFTTRKSVDKALATWRKMEADPKQADAVRDAARRCINGRVQVAAEIWWVDVDD